MAKRFVCWLRGHRFLKLDKSPGGELEKVYCCRCNRTFAVFHPQRYFGEWDWWDDECMRSLK